MTEISGSRPVAQPAVTTRPLPSAGDLAVKLLQPLDGLMASGESAKAEVVGLKEVAQNFQLLLRVTLDSGRQTTVQASSAQPLAQGTTLAVTALSDTRLAFALQAGSGSPMTSLDLEQLPIGTLLQGKVVSREQLPMQVATQVAYKVVVSLLNTPLAGSQLELQTHLDLPLGSLLSARVQGDQSLNFLPLSGRLDQLALAQQLGVQQGRQGSLEGLLASLQGLGDTSDMPEGLRGSIERLLGALPSAEQLSNGKGLARALENSGLFLEGRLLGGQAGALGNDMKANLLRLIGQLLPTLPGSAPLAAASANAMTQALPALARNVLGSLGQVSGRQQAMSFPLPSRLLQAMDGESDLEALLKLAAAAISRLQTHQLSSLAQSQTGPDGALLTTWQTEIPMRNHHDLVPLQVKIQHEEPPASSNKQERKDPLWRIDLAFDLDPLGPLQVQAQLSQGNLSSQLWAERAGTASLIDRELPQLRERLVAAGLNVSELACRQGTPPQGPKTSLEQRWVDETA